MGLNTKLFITVSRFARADVIFNSCTIADNRNIALASARRVVVLHGVLCLGGFDAWISLILVFRVWCRHFGAFVAGNGSYGIR